MAIIFDGESKLFYGTKAERLAEPISEYPYPSKFCEYDTQDVYMSNGTSWFLIGKGITVANGTVDSAAVALQLNDIAKYLATPITTYTYNSNTEIVVSAVDTTGDTFTSINHGLSNGNIVAPTLNTGVAGVYPPAVMQTPIIPINGVYFVVGVTPNTFQLSLTSGGAVIDLTTNASLDLTKWHFEKISIADITISGLGGINRCLLRIRGKSLVCGSNTYVLPNSVAVASNATTTTSTTFTYPATKAMGSILTNSEILIDYKNQLSIRSFGVAIDSNTTTGYIATSIAKQVNIPSEIGGLINSVTFIYINATGQWAFANGTTVEVYKI